MDNDTSATMIRVLGGDSLSSRWNEFGAKYIPMLQAYLRDAFPSVDIDEVIDDTLIAFVSILPDYQYTEERHGHFRNFIRGVAKNKAREWLRKREKDSEEAAEYREYEQMRREENADDRATARVKKRMNDIAQMALDQVLADKKVSEQSKQIFVRIAINCENPEEVADLFGVTRNNVDQIKSRMMEKLKSLVRSLEALSPM